MLARDGSPQFKKCLLSAPLGSGLTTFCKVIAHNQKRDPVFVDALELQTPESVKELEARVNSTNRLFRK